MKAKLLRIEGNIYCSEIIHIVFFISLSFYRKEIKSFLFPTLTTEQQQWWLEYIPYTRRALSGKKDKSVPANIKDLQRGYKRANQALNDKINRYLHIPLYQ